MIRLRGLDDCALYVRETRVSPAAETVFAAALYLVLEAGRVVSRRELFAVFWPSVAESTAAHRLRQTLYRLNALGAAIQCDRSDVILPRSAVESDVHRLLSTRDGKQLEALADGGLGDLLPGYEPQFSAPFAEWLEEQRERVSFAVRRAFGASVALKRARGDWQAAEAQAARCLARDPWNEEATLVLAESAVMQGSRVEALGVLDRYLRELDAGDGEIHRPAAMLRRQIAEALHEDELPTPTTAHVGRELELGVLTRALQRTAAVGGSTYLVWGEVGIGKTRLTTELARLAGMRAWRVVTTASQPQDTRRPLSAFVNLAPQLLELPGALGSSPESMRYLRRLVEHDPRVTTLSEETRDAEQLFANVRRAILDLFDAVAGESPLLVVIEDVHWLDDRSWELVRELTHWMGTRRMLLVLTSTQRSTLERFGESESVRPYELHLAPLSQQTSQELLRNVLAGTARGVDEKFLDWCVSAGGGNPYYLAELALHGERDGEQFRAPATLDKLVESRLAHLGPLSCRTLQACCSLGMHSTFERIERVLGARTVDLMASLEDLERRGLIDVDGGRVVRRHELLTQAALARLTRASRAFLDRRVARVLEEDVAAGGSAAVMWECAEHWQRGGEVSRATELLRSCARHSLELGLPMEAAVTLERALALVPTNAERLALMEERIHALHLAAAWPDLEAAITEVMSLRSQIGEPGPRHCDLELLLFQTRWRLAPADIAHLRIATRCVNDKDATVNHRLKAATWACMLADNLCDKRRASSIYSLVDSLVTTGDADEIERLYFELVYHCAFGNPELGARAAEKLLAATSNWTDPTVHARHLTHAAFAFRCNAQLTEAIHVAEQAVELGERRGMPSYSAAGANQLTSIHLILNDLASARTWQRRAAELLGNTIDPPARASILSNEAEIAVRDGDLENAERLIREGEALLARPSSPRTTARFTAFMWHLRLLRGEAPPRRGALRELLRLHLRTRHATHQDLFAQVIYQLHCLLGKADDGAAILMEYIRDHRRVKWPLSPELNAIVTSIAANESAATPSRVATPAGPERREEPRAGSVTVPRRAKRAG